MKIKDIIEKLSKFNPELPLTLVKSAGGGDVEQFHMDGHFWSPDFRDIDPAYGTPSEVRVMISDTCEAKYSHKFIREKV